MVKNHHLARPIIDVSWYELTRQLVYKSKQGYQCCKKWKAFIRKIDTKTDDYSTVLKTIRAFLTKPFVAVVENKIFTDNWIVQNGQWM